MIAARIWPGPFRHETAEGEIYSLDRRLSPQQFGVLVATVRAAATVPDEVRWVEFRGEAPPLIGVIDAGADDHERVISL